MGISKVHIKNFKSIRDSECFDLLPVNILIGANGSGKSNFISFFELVRKIYEKNLQVYVAQRGGSEKFLYNGIKGSEYLYGKLIFDNEWKNEYEFKLLPTTDNNFIISDNSNLTPPNSKNIHSKIVSHTSRESNLSDSEEYRDKYLRNFIEAMRIFHFHDTSFTSKMRQPAPLSDDAYLQADGSNLPVILNKIKKHNHSHYQKIISIIKDNLPYFYDFYLEPQNGYLSLRWKVVNEDVILDAHQLSDGSLRLMALVTLLMQPKLPEIIIIDEPELGLHPYAINNLTQLIHLASIHSQIIISTQSSDLIDAYIANAENTENAVQSIVVTEYKNQQTKFNRLSYEALRNWLEKYTLKELWDKNIIGGRP